VWPLRRACTHVHRWRYPHRVPAVQQLHARSEGAGGLVVRGDRLVVACGGLRRRDGGAAHELLQLLAHRLELEQPLQVRARLLLALRRPVGGSPANETRGASLTDIQYIIFHPGRRRCNVLLENPIATPRARSTLGERSVSLGQLPLHAQSQAPLVFAGIQGFNRVLRNPTRAPHLSGLPPVRTCTDTAPLMMM
jgi:hypothetical protein